MFHIGGTAGKCLIPLQGGAGVWGKGVLSVLQEVSLPQGSCAWKRSGEACVYRENHVSKLKSPRLSHVGEMFCVWREWEGRAPPPPPAVEAKAVPCPFHSSLPSPISDAHILESRIPPALQPGKVYRHDALGLLCWVPTHCHASCLPLQKES